MLSLLTNELGSAPVQFWQATYPGLTGAGNRVGGVRRRYMSAGDDEYLFHWTNAAAADDLRAVLQQLAFDPLGLDDADVVNVVDSLRASHPVMLLSAAERVDAG